MWIYEEQKEFIALGFPGASEVKNSLAKAADPGSIPGSGRSPREGRQSTAVFLSKRSHGQRNPGGCSPRGHKGSAQLSH